MNEKVNARIQALKSELEMLEKELAEPKKESRFKAEKLERYKTLIQSEGKIKAIIVQECNCIADSSRHKYFNYFRPDTDEADRMAEKINLLLAMTARVKELNGDWVADWENKDQKKWGIDSITKNLFIDYYTTCGHGSFIFGLSAQSEELAKILLEEFKERIEKYY